MENKKIEINKKHNKDLSIYIHIPFCERKCNYCDFLSFSLNNCDDKNIKDYIDNLILELRKFGKESKEYLVKSIYIGGGTPSALDAKLISSILRELRNSFNVYEKAEISIEVNPSSINEQKAKSYFEDKINRISLGAQSFIDEELEILGRLHRGEDIVTACNILKNTGFNNISIDLMFDIPRQTEEALSYSLDEAFKLDVNHISIYSLEIEEGTKFYDLYKRGKIDISDSEKLIEKYKYIQKALDKKGYVQYEISNFSKGNFHSYHNTNYWNYGEYLGLGLGSSSFYKGKRFKAPDKFDAYFKYVNDNVANILEEASKSSEKNEISIFVFTALRKTNGFSMSEFKNKFGIDFLALYEKEIKEIESLYDKALVIENDRVFIKSEYMATSNEIMCHFILE